MSCHISSAGREGIDISTFFLIPEEFFDDSSQFFIFCSVNASIFTNLFADFLHCAKTGSVKHLLCTERAVFIHIRPVNIYPVFFFPDQETMLIASAIAESHKRNHLRINKFQKVPVTISFIMIIYTE